MHYASGATSTFRSSDLQRHYRDANAGAQQILLNWDANSTIYGKVARGLDPGQVRWWRRLGGSVQRRLRQERSGPAAEMNVQEWGAATPGEFRGTATGHDENGQATFTADDTATPPWSPGMRAVPSRAAQVRRTAPSFWPSVSG